MIVMLDERCNLDVIVLHVTDHIPSCATCLVGDARTLFRSMCRILSLPLGTRLSICHDCYALRPRFLRSGKQG
jgi:hypothetical protein